MGLLNNTGPGLHNQNGIELPEEEQQKKISLSWEVTFVAIHKDLMGGSVFGNTECQC